MNNQPNLRDYCKLVAEGLIKAKYNEDKSLVLLKYAHKVFYHNLWLQHPLLCEARGHVFCTKTGDMIVKAPTKVFNLHENGAGNDIPAHKDVSIARKVNGFLANVTRHKGKLLITTTGSFDSDFVAIARKHIEKLDWSFLWSLPFYRDNEMTFHFEIVDESDPHIVTELPGAYLLGVHMLDGRMAHEDQVDDTAMDLGCARPGAYHLPWGEVLELLKTVKHEGFMIRDIDTGVTLLKLKSPHYLSKKFLMRMNKAKTEAMFRDIEGFKMDADEEFYSIAHKIVRNHDLEIWNKKTDQERRVWIEKYYEDRQA